MSWFDAIGFVLDEIEETNTDHQTFGISYDEDNSNKSSNESDKED